MNYKYAFVLETPNDYLRKVDLSYMEFIRENEFSLQFEDGIVYLEEDVNSRRADRIISLLSENNIRAYHINTLKWKNFQKLQQVS